MNERQTHLMGRRAAIAAAHREHVQGLQHRWRGHSEELGELWSLRRTQKRARCTIATHPRGWELRLIVGTELRRSQLHDCQMKLLDEAEVWKAGMLESGWKICLGD